MVLLFGQQGDTGHESECGGKIRKGEAPDDRLAFCVKIPFTQSIKRGRALVVVKLFDQCPCLPLPPTASTRDIESERMGLCRHEALPPQPIRLYVAGMMGQGQIKFENVSCRRGGRMLFENLCLALRPGDAAIVSGRNGVGKSSLLRLAAGLLDAAGGTVHIDGRIAFADESLALERHLPLEKALGFWARMDGGDVMDALALVSLDHLAGVPVRMLSTGQRKRAMLARVLASSADIWLLDEPANGLDSASLDTLSRLIADHRTRGGIVLAASHQPLGIDSAEDVRLEALQ